MLPKRQELKYEEFFASTAKNDILDQKTTIMIQLAASFVAGCYPWMEHFFGVAKEIDISDDEIGIVQSIVMAVSAGSMKVQFRQVRENIDQHLGYH